MARRLASALAISAAIPAAGQQWTVVVLHASGNPYSEVRSVTASRQGGSNVTPTEWQGGFWVGNASSWTPLSSIGSPGDVFGMEGDQQVGYYQNAALWRGTPQSFTSLHPPGATSSQAHAVRANMQVGVVNYPPVVSHAALWRGTLQSFADLHPAGALGSSCLSTDGLRQGGWIDWPDGYRRAAIWNGMPQSFITLSMMSSQVNGMAPGVQVGQVLFPGQGYHGVLWRGTAQSVVDLNPLVGTTRFLATTGQIHVGQGILGATGQAHALINFGTIETWHDLHQYLPPQYTSFSAAQSVYQDGATIYVGGYAVAGDRQAILWIGTVPCYANCDQSTGTPRLTANDFQCFLNSFAFGGAAANCDHSTGTPALTGNDFQCYINAYAAGCS